LIEIIYTITCFYAAIGFVMIWYTNHRISESDTEKYYWKRKYSNLKENGIDSYQSGDERYL